MLSTSVRALERQRGSARASKDAPSSTSTTTSASAARTSPRRRPPPRRAPSRARARRCPPRRLRVRREPGLPPRRPRGARSLETMATSLPASAFSSELFPALGGPTGHTRAPARAARPTAARGDRSSSRRSSATGPVSDAAAQPVNAHLVVLPESAWPRRARARVAACASSARTCGGRAARLDNACRRCASVSASSRSARPSACVRSNLPFLNRAA